jgi:hypothetical protein
VIRDGCATSTVACPNSLVSGSNKDVAWQQSPKMASISASCLNTLKEEAGELLFLPV